ncbi:MAG: tail fiber domain-containing protein [Candidatus Omnitrophica bacterium]|nr:tail fiber domain-containing protein [Candidatus Omnitrophota bacterium]
MRKSFLYFLPLAIILLPSPASADKFTLTTFFPAPFGNYKSLVLSPQSALPTSDCPLGTIYANASDNSLVYYCGPESTGPLSEFAPIAGAWSLSGTNLYLTDTSTPENKKVGIGTSTPAFKLTLENDGGIFADNMSSPIIYTPLPVGIFNSALVWYPGKSAFRAGFSISQLLDADIGDYSMAMGYNNFAKGNASTVWGGATNTTGMLSGNVSSTIAGGQGNTSNGLEDQILGGQNNQTNGYSRASGKSNTTSNYGTIGGGENNTNSNDSTATTISGGSNNQTSAEYSTVSGGNNNITWGPYSTISGGWNNFIPAHGFSYGTIAGGESNQADANYAVISGGIDNKVSGDYSTVSGGLANIATGGRSTITGGSNNNCAALYCSITGGDTNIIMTSTSGTIIGGQFNSAKGINATILGGANNNAWGKYSIAAGRYMNLGLLSDYNFMWGYSNSSISAVTSSNIFLIYSGKMGIRDTDPNALLEINGNGSSDDYFALTNSTGTPGDRFIIKNNGYVGVNASAPAYPLQFGNGAYVDATGNFMPASSREYKENIADLSVADAMKVFSKLEPVQYRYKNEPHHKYLGFIAEDVPDLVASQDRKGIAPMDIAAVLTKVVAHQQDILEQQRIETEKLLHDVQVLKSKLKERSGP